MEHWHLREKDFFWELPLEREEFLSLSTKRHVKKNELVFFEGDPGDSAFYLKNGEIRIFQVSPLGKECIVFVRKSGEMFGLAEVICKEKRKCTAQALTDCCLYEIKSRDFEILLSRHYPLSRRVIEIMGRRMRYLGEQIENLMVCDVTTRLLKLLLYLSCDKLLDRGSLNEPIVVPVKLTQEQIATMVGSCQQTVSEKLKQLEKDGLILTSKKEITILKPVDLLKSTGT